MQQRILPFLTFNFRNIWEKVSTSYWFIPVCMMIGAFLIWIICYTLIQRATLPDWMLTVFPLVSMAGAQQVLSTIATSIITATSIAFSMTVVALTLASSQFGPRLLRTFMLDKATQCVLGLLVSSFIFSLITLHHLDSVADNKSALAMLCGMTVCLAIADTFAIIYFIHHIGRFIQADEVIYRCYQELISNLDGLLPTYDVSDKARPIAAKLLPPAAHSVAITTREAGYVQTVNYTLLLHCERNGIEGIDVHARSGDYVFPGAVVLTVHCRQTMSADELHGLLDAVTLGSKRTPVQDPEFAIGQLVELALRALSPGINDPVTAISCLDRLTTCCIYMSQKEFPAASVVNKSTGMWLRRRTFSLTGILDKAFNQIRHDGKDHLDIALHILFCLSVLQKHLPHSMQATLSAQARATYELALASPLSDPDRNTLKTAFMELQ
ncbi:DUF2254 domain-containing protein [Alteromonas halophila]|uniref:DUF2254 domain-containing protein n=1 Tax=Alteromonas halophila TaxID=516698 RepID=A0A918JQI7_9ALTE|nr:DUF2254 domain-containing protein [Alteromonas halophila]GGW94122.1 hypothetical protein GCM10007391_30540 [Alteromonas halophila]